MKNLLSFIFLGIFLFACTPSHQSKDTAEASTTNAERTAESEFYNFKKIGLDGSEVDFSQFKGKKVLLINVASKCGYTPQYEGLQKLHEQYGDKVALVGVPANNFGKQEPGSNNEIAEFCSKNYGVTFQMLEKVSVKGDDKDELYAWLTDKTRNGWNDQEPTWNFCKYLINEKGELTDFFKSGVKPMSEEMIAAINK